MWLSFVIPLYNCEKYVAACLDSILLQGLEEDEYEVIVINDGSTDKGASVVEGYCKKYKNFRLIHKENGGVSSARNKGIEEARGEYIHFMDADDRLLPDGMRILKEKYVQAYNGCDMFTFWAHTVDRHYSAEKWEHIHPHRVLFHGSFGEYGNLYGFGWSCFMRIISRKFLLRYFIRFQPYVIGEDVMFMMAVFAITNATIVATNLDIYRYCVREGSALTRNNRQHIERALRGYLNLFKEVRQIEKSSSYDKRIFDNEIKQFQRGAFMRLLSSHLSYTTLQELLTQSKEIGFYPIENPITHLQRFINKATEYPWFIYLLSIPFRHIFLPYIKPYVNRN